MREHAVDFKSEGEVLEKEKEWKAALPWVGSAYKPSGRFTQETLRVVAFFSVGGALLGAVVTMAVTLTCAAFVVWGSSHVTITHTGTWKHWGFEANPFPLWVLCLLVGALSFFLAFTGVGVLSGAVVRRGLRRGKNRSATLAMVASLLSGALGWTAFWMGMSWVSDALEATSLGSALQAMLSGEARQVVMTLGYITTGAITLRYAWGAAGAVKFCETCGVYLQKVRSRWLDFVSMQRLVQSVSSAGLVAAGQVLVGAWVVEGKADLERCPLCGSGYLDVTALFEARWLGGTPGSYSSSWLVLSRSLSPTDAESLLRCLDAPPPQGPLP